MWMKKQFFACLFKESFAIDAGRGSAAHESVSTDVLLAIIGISFTASFLTQFLCFCRSHANSFSRDSHSWPWVSFRIAYSCELAITHFGNKSIFFEYNRRSYQKISNLFLMFPYMKIDSRCVYARLTKGDHEPIIDASYIFVLFSFPTNKMLELCCTNTQAEKCSNTKTLYQNAMP